MMMIIIRQRSILIHILQRVVQSNQYNYYYYYYKIMFIIYKLAYITT
jgi:hypothetical protein